MAPLHLHSSTRRPAPLKDTDYDHEIRLVDATTPQPSRTRSPSQSASDGQLSPGVLSDTSSRRHSGAPLKKHETPQKIRRELTQRKYKKYQDRRLGEEPEQAPPEEDGNQDNDAAEDERGRTRDGGKKASKEPESAIDVLFENERGGFLCGIPLFSSRALGNLDPSPWTNIALKTSATNITNAQVPDPSWEWLWKEWSVNHTDEVDEEGWEYSFAFSKMFSWHGPSWWNSCVRRRAWIRKRVKKHTPHHVQEAHMLNSDYFTIHPALDRSRSRGSTIGDALSKRYSVSQLAQRRMKAEVALDEISDIRALMVALRAARIDREKMEAVESFITNGGDELYYLKERMHDIMRLFIFQASRRLLLSHLSRILDEASEDKKEEIEGEKEADPAKQRLLDNLNAAVQAADSEVKKLEFWSDVKDMAEKGETQGAVDESQGWDERWTGVDNSGPKDVISDRNAIGTDDCKKSKGNGTAVSFEQVNGKGKEKAEQ